MTSAHPTRRRAMRRWPALAAVLGLLALGGPLACGGEPRRLEMKKVQAAPPADQAPKQSAEEAAGEVPPLKGLVKGIPLVPETLVPPAPPPDPAFEP